jgi:hypothetical protein
MANNTSTGTTNNSSNGNNPVVGDDSFEIARRLPNNTPGRVTVEVNAPWRQDNFGNNRELGRAGQEFPGGGLTMDVRNTATVKIDVQVLQQSELGLLNATGAQLQQNLATAMRAKQDEDERKYGLTPDQMVQKAKDLGYYGSGAHQAWAEAASARTGGRASPEYMMRLDPLGGTNGNGPKIEAGGIYPHPLSKIAMGHDTDWNLGRYFNAGPMNGLYGNKADDKSLGLYGLDGIDPTSWRSNVQPPSRAQYGRPNDIYRVEYNEHPTQTRRAGIDPENGVAVASPKPEVIAENFGNRAGHFNTALAAANGNKDVAAAVVQSAANAGLDPNAELKVSRSNTTGDLIPSQSTGMRGDPVNPANVQPAQATLAALNTPTNQPQVTPTQQQVAAVTEENPTQGGRRMA